MLSRWTEPSHKAATRSELQVKHVPLRHCSVLPIPAVRTLRIFMELAPLPTSCAKIVERYVESSGVASAHDGDEPLAS